MSQLYQLLNRLITRGLYEDRDMKDKLNVFLLADEISINEYNELINLISPPTEEVVEEV